ncbi:MAG TPA: hypothetical protein VNS80_06855 [Pseudolysinimonas sp.]|nr:hypothetical protein [Pseudolysinimonas sp.]
MGETISHRTTDQLARERVKREHPDWKREHPDWLADLAADLDLATRVAMRVRPDGIVEVTVAGELVGFIEHVAPVFVALLGDRPVGAVEVAQRHTLADAVEVLRARRDGSPH